MGSANNRFFPLKEEANKAELFNYLIRVYQSNIKLFSGKSFSIFSY